MPLQTQLHQWPEAVGARAAEKGWYTSRCHGVRGETSME